MLSFEEMVLEICKISISKYVSDGCPLAMINPNTLAESAIKIAGAIQIGLKKELDKDIRNQQAIHISTQLNIVDALFSMRVGKVVVCLYNGRFYFKHGVSYFSSHNIYGMGKTEIIEFSEELILSPWRVVNDNELKDISGIRPEQ